MSSRAIAWYDQHASTLVSTYESLDFKAAHGWMLDLLPKGRGLILDVGAGTGRDAAGLVELGHEVVAVEPSSSMVREASMRHADARIRWLDDRLPALEDTHRTGLAFDLILLSAVWQHIAPADRPRAFRKLVTLLKPGGVLAVTLRIGAAEDERAMHDVSQAEIESLARGHGAFIERSVEARDILGRSDVRWIQMAVRLPDDGTGALPLLRHVVLQDAKSSTYKLALLRSVARIADGAAGLVRETGDDRVSIPLGLVALYWIRLYLPLLSAGLPQSPTNRGLSGLGFVNDGFCKLLGMRAQRSASGYAMRKWLRNVGAFRPGGCQQDDCADAGSPYDLPEWPPDHGSDCRPRRTSTSFAGHRRSLSAALRGVARSRPPLARTVAVRRLDRAGDRCRVDSPDARLCPGTGSGIERGQDHARDALVITGTGCRRGTEARQCDHRIRRAAFLCVVRGAPHQGTPRHRPLLPVGGVALRRPVEPSPVDS